MPSQDRLRLYDQGLIEQSGLNPRHPHQQRPVTTVQPQTRRSSPQCDVELMTEKQVLGFEPVSQLGIKFSEGTRVYPRSNQT